MCGFKKILETVLTYNSIDVWVLGSMAIDVHSVAWKHGDRCS